jgi:deoxyribonuclease-1
MARFLGIAVFRLGDLSSLTVTNTVTKTVTNKAVNTVVTSVAIAVASFVGVSAQAQSEQLSSKTIGYYGKDFYQDLRGNLKDADLIRHLQFILRGQHSSEAGGYESIEKQCSGKSCYQHVAVGYDKARIFMMGSYYLVRQGKSYALPDMYCGGFKTEEDFPSNPPAPNTIPNANILNTEHTWPQSKFSQRYSKDMQKSDLHHLFPTDSELNSIRGNNKFGEVVRDSKVLKCRASRTGSPERGGDEVFEPPQSHKGNVARAIFYFSVRYDLPVGAQQEATLRLWNREDPVDEEEMRRNNEIHKLQGNRNPFIDFPDLPERIQSFDGISS